MHVHMSHETTIWEKPGHILWKWCPATALPQLCDSRRFLKATGRLPADRSCHRVVAGDSSVIRKGCRQTEQSSDIRGKTRGHFPCEIWPDFTKIAVLCDVLTCIIKFLFSKQWVTVKFNSVALNSTADSLVSVWLSLVQLLPLCTLFSLITAHLHEPMTFLLWTSHSLWLSNVKTCCCTFSLPFFYVLTSLYPTQLPVIVHLYDTICSQWL